MRFAAKEWLEKAFPMATWKSNPTMFGPKGKKGGQCKFDIVGTWPLSGIQVIVEVDGCQHLGCYLEPRQIFQTPFRQQLRSCTVGAHQAYLATVVHARNRAATDPSAILS